MSLIKDGEYYTPNFIEIEDTDGFPLPTESKWVPINSSFIDSAAYFEPLEILEIQLKNGQQYSYRDVPKIIYDDFMKSKSKGQYFNHNIKNKYRKTNLS